MYVVDCDELARAGVLAEPGGPVSLPESVLSVFGVNLERDYQLAGKFETAPIVGGFTPVKVQRMLKPRRPVVEAVRQCKAVRAHTALAQ